MNILEKLGGRKFVGLLIVAFLGFSLVYIGKLDPDTYWGFLTVQLGIYAYSNVKAKEANQEQILKVQPIRDSETI